MAAGGVQEQWGGIDFPAVCPHALPSCQRLSRSAGTQVDTKRRDKTADGKWIETVILKGDSSFTQVTELLCCCPEVFVGSGL